MQLVLKESHFECVQLRRTHSKCDLLLNFWISSTAYETLRRLMRNYLIYQTIVFWVSGSTTVKVDPCPNSDSTQMRP